MCHIRSYPSYAFQERPGLQDCEDMILSFCISSDRSSIVVLSSPLSRCHILSFHIFCNCSLPLSSSIFVAWFPLLPIRFRLFLSVPGILFLLSCFLVTFLCCLIASPYFASVLSLPCLCNFYFAKFLHSLFVANFSPSHPCLFVWSSLSPVRVFLCNIFKCSCRYLILTNLFSLSYPIYFHYDDLQTYFVCSGLLIEPLRSFCFFLFPPWLDASCWLQYISIGLVPCLFKAVF